MVPMTKERLREQITDEDIFQRLISETGLFDVDLSNATIGEKNTRHIYVLVSACDPKTEQEVECAPQEEIDEYFSALRVGVYSVETYLDLEDIDNPFRQHLNILGSTYTKNNLIEASLTPENYELTDSILYSFTPF